MTNYTVRDMCRIEGMRRRSKEKIDRVRYCRKALQNQLAAQVNAANSYMTSQQQANQQSPSWIGGLMGFGYDR